MAPRTDALLAACNLDGRLLGVFGRVGMRCSRFGNFFESVGEGQDKIADAFAGGRGNGVKGELALGAKIAQLHQACAVGSGVELGGHNNHRFFAKRFVKRAKFAIDDFEGVHGVGVGEIAGVDQVNEKPRAFDMTQETDAEAGAFVRAFDQAGQVGNDEGAADIVAFFAGAAAGRLRHAIGADNTEIRLERGERIICNFWTRRGNDGNQRGLAGIWKTDQANISEQFQFEPQMAFFAGIAVLVFAWRLMPGLREILIATASASAVRDQDALAGRGEVGDGFAGVFVVGDGAYRHEQSHVVAGVAGAIRPFPVAAAVGFEFAVVAIAQQRVVVWIGFKLDAAAASAIAAGRSAARNIFFAAECDAAIAAVARFYVDFGFIDKH